MRAYREFRGKILFDLFPEEISNFFVVENLKFKNYFQAHILLQKTQIFSKKIFILIIRRQYRVIYKNHV